MKKIFSMLLLMIMVCSLTLGSTGSIVMAAEVDTPVEEEDTEEYVNLYSGVTVGTSWVTIVSASPGVNGNIKVTSYSGSKADILMLGANGNMVWYEENAIDSFGERTFWCGSDVYTVKIKFHSGASIVYVSAGT